MRSDDGVWSDYGNLEWIPTWAWRDQPSRRGLSLVDHTGDRAITVIGERLTPTAEDSLPWELAAGL